MASSHAGAKSSSLKQLSGRKKASMRETPLPQYKPFQYQQLSDAKQQIRLITLFPASSSPTTIRVSLKVVPFVEDEELCAYEASSYVWGSSEDPLSVLIQDDSQAFGSLPVTRNLHEVLVNLRLENESRVFWIDAICINQQDVAEKSHQVALMGRIYASAASVTAWLGLPSADSEVAMDALEAISANLIFDNETGTVEAFEHASRDWSDPKRILPLDDAQVIALQRLLQRPWFDRVWVWQEVLLSAGHAWLKCGSQSLTWLAFRNALHCIYARGWLYVHETDDFATLLDAIISLCRLRQQGLLGIVSSVQVCTCSDPLDKIYAVMGFAASRLPIEPDYAKSPQEVYTTFTINWLERTERLEILRYTSGKSRMPDLPSFVPDWSAQISHNGSFLWGYADAGMKRQKAVLDRQSLRLKGIIVCQVLQTIPYPCYEDVSGKRSATENLSKFLLDLTEETFPKINAEQLSRLCRTLRNGYLAETTTGGSVANLEDCRMAISELLEAQGGLLAHYRNANLHGSFQFYCEGQSFCTYSEDAMGLAPRDVQLGDVIAMFPGLNVALALSPAGNGSYTIIGPAYCDGVMKGEVILGPLPSHYEIKYDVFPDYSSRSLRGFKNLHTGAIELEDPRLPPLPPDWSQIQETTMQEDAIYRNSDTLEERWGYWNDPRLDLEFLESQGVQFKDIFIV